MARIVVSSIAAALFAAFAATASAAQPASPSGVWLTQSGNVEVTIAPCGQALCGDVSRVLGNVSMTAPGKASAAAPAHEGLRILSGLHPEGDGWRGKIYNRENGRTYDVIVHRRPDRALDVRAFVGVPQIGKSQVWRAAS